MAGDRYVVLGLGAPRSSWFVDVARWATVGSVPVEFVKCISAEELRARVESGRPFSAALIDADTGAIDRDLLELTSRSGVALIAVGGLADTDWGALGAAQVLEPTFSRERLVEVLARCSSPVGGATTVPGDHSAEPQSPATTGLLYAVTGSGGVGTSSTAIALAQGLARRHDHERVLLADLCLHAEQAMLHDARDVVPGVQELVDGHRSGRPGPTEVRALTFAVPARGYRLLLGLRRHHDWSALRPRAFVAALDGLQSTFASVVVDVDADAEGERETGSVEVEERNLMARTVLPRADVVIAVGRAGVKGLHSLVRVVNSLREAGVAPEQVVAVVVASPRAPAARGQLVRAFADLTGASAGLTPVNGPLFVPERRSLDDSHRDGTELHPSLCEPLVRAADAVIARRTDSAAHADPPAIVAPGSLGRWADQGLGK